MTAAGVKMTGDWYGLPPWVGFVVVCFGVFLFGVWLGLWWGEERR